MRQFAPLFGKPVIAGRYCYWSSFKFTFHQVGLVPTPDSVIYGRAAADNPTERGTRRVLALGHFTPGPNGAGWIWEARVKS